MPRVAFPLRFTQTPAPDGPLGEGIDTVDGRIQRIRSQRTTGEAQERRLAERRKRRWRSKRRTGQGV